MTEPSPTEALVAEAGRVADQFRAAQMPDSAYDEDQALAELDAVGFLAVDLCRRLSTALTTAQAENRLLEERIDYAGESLRQADSDLDEARAALTKAEEWAATFGLGPMAFGTLVQEAVHGADLDGYGEEGAGYDWRAAGQTILRGLTPLFAKARTDALEEVKKWLDLDRAEAADEYAASYSGADVDATFRRVDAMLDNLIARALAVPGPETKEAERG